MKVYEHREYNDYIHEQMNTMETNLRTEAYHCEKCGTNMHEH